MSPVHSATHVSRSTPEMHLGIWSIVLGVLGFAAVGWGWYLTYTTADPPEWSRIAGLAFLPIGLFGALGTGIAALRLPRTRVAGFVGLALAGLTVLSFVLLMNSVPY
ncbi:hypothetical protein [Raineyella fluvialis]|uniref:Uncharacterized protein n=1 Tax=Raineyella fluvialis TaxID=2662261 RepID=A0A5Q2F844_9ACTN|nr:hypothetical protein [Raineyella fluvialis]QGF22999.1 hypothetical protein Rai3103_04190 [Raineyella fluvialis]